MCRGASPAAGPDSPVILLLDGEVWHRAHPIIPELARRISAGAMPPLTVSLLESGGPQQRMLDYEAAPSSMRSMNGCQINGLASFLMSQLSVSLIVSEAIFNTNNNPGFRFKNQYSAIGESVPRVSSTYHKFVKTTPKPRATKNCSTEGSTCPILRFLRGLNGGNELEVASSAPEVVERARDATRLSRFLLSALGPGRGLPLAVLVLLSPNLPRKLLHPKRRGREPLGV